MPAAISADDPTEAIVAAWRAESARLVGALTRMTRDVELAEDLAQDALVNGRRHAVQIRGLLRDGPPWPALGALSTG